MKNKELFEKTVSVLVKAYQNDTLEHSDCRFCAVGNMVAAACGIDNEKKEWSESESEWSKKAKGIPDWFNGWSAVFLTRINIDGQYIDENEYYGNSSARYQIDSTGYKWQDLAKIEHAFETADKGYSKDDWMLNGLLAVYDTLCEIHEVKKEEVTKGELVFVKEALYGKA